MTKIKELTMNEVVKEWCYRAGMRAIKTFAQTAIALIGTGTVGFVSVDWLQVISVSGVACIVSILTSLAGLPECESDN